MRYMWLVASLSTVAFTGCGMESAQARSGAQPGFRVRSDFTAPLNADQGWAGALNEDVTINADRPFRVRFEVEGGGASGSQQFRLQYRRNGGDWTDVEAHDFPKPDSDNAKTPRVSIVSCAAYENGAGDDESSDGLGRRISGGRGHQPCRPHTVVERWGLSW